MMAIENFATLDSTNAYMSMKLADDSQTYCCCKSRGKYYKFLRVMTYGLSCAHILMSWCASASCLVYLEDIFICGKTFEEVYYESPASNKVLMKNVSSVTMSRMLQISNITPASVRVPHIIYHSIMSSFSWTSGQEIRKRSKQIRTGSQKNLKRVLQLIV
jgi:hypothetical protein